MKVSFNNKDACFYKSVTDSIETYFKLKNLSKTGNWKLYLKTAILILLALSVYLGIFIPGLTIMPIAVLGLILGLISAFIGFNVMHDANHGSYCANKKINSILGLTLNALGGNSFIWKHKHNIIHHTYPNVDGMDDDIAKSPFMRMCSTQPWSPMHRLQHLYTPFLYSVSSLLWVLFQDFEKYFRPRLNSTAMASKMSVGDHFIFWISKTLYLFFYLVLPGLLMGWLNATVFFLALHVGLGFTLAIVFQLAHVVETTSFEAASDDKPKRIEHEWAVHQLQTTSNFSPSNKVLSWLLGGLNYQVEHHLFPRISHIHYPAISKIVLAKCQEFNLPYHCIPSFGKAINSHFRLIRLLGRKPKPDSLNLKEQL